MNARSPLKLGVLISGRGSNMIAIQEAIAAKKLNAEIVTVISSSASAKGIEKAKALGLKTVTIEQKTFDSKAEYEQNIVNKLVHENVELVVLAGYMKLVGPTILNAFKNKIINIHPSLLPSFKGLHAQKQALEAGVKIAGCTVHFVDETLDGGKIILQKSVNVIDDDTEESLSKRILEQEHKALPEVIQLFSEGKIERR